MNDERYVGVVRGIITKKREALDYAESMAENFVKARLAGFGLNKSAYTVWFDEQGLLTSKGKSRWHITMITNLMNIDQELSSKRDGELAKFDYSVKYFSGHEYKKPRMISDEAWSVMRAEYVSSLDALIERAKAIARIIRGDTIEASAPKP